jgi:hypothetical protein
MTRKKFPPQWHVGPRALPDDADVKIFLAELIKERREILENVLQELSDTVDETLKGEQPVEFAYGKLLNYLAAQKGPEIIYLCAAALWELWEAEGGEQWNTDRNN